MHTTPYNTLFWNCPFFSTTPIHSTHITSAYPPRMTLDPDRMISPSFILLWIQKWRSKLADTWYYFTDHNKSILLLSWIVVFAYPANTEGNLFNQEDKIYTVTVRNLSLLRALIIAALNVFLFPTLSSVVSLSAFGRFGRKVPVACAKETFFLRTLLQHPFMGNAGNYSKYFCSILVENETTNLKASSCL